MPRSSRSIAEVPQLASCDWGTFLSAFDWSHVVHLTTRYATSEHALTRRFTDRFIRRLAAIAQQRVPYFYAIERKDHGCPHIHGLIAGTAALPVRRIAERWDIGYSRIVRYSPARGAAFYASKSLRGATEHYGIATRMPPRTGLVVAELHNLLTAEDTGGARLSNATSLLISTNAEAP